jgi:hypothetical protein
LNSGRRVSALLAEHADEQAKEIIVMTRKIAGLLFTVNILIFSSGEAAAQSYRLIPDSVHIYTYNRETYTTDFSGVNYNYYTNGLIDSIVTANSSRTPVAKTIYTYDNGNMTEVLSLVVNTGNWLNSQNQVFYYDGDHVVTDRIVTKWIGGQWQNLNRFTYLYDESGRLSVYNREFWRTNIWTDFSTDSLFYDEAGFLTERSARLKSTGQYVTRTLYYYDLSGLKSYQVRQDYLNNAWTNVNTTQYYYNKCGTQVMSETEKWLAGSWQPESQSRVFFRIELLPGARKVPVCHHGQTLYVVVQTLDAHLAHGDCIGECMTAGPVSQTQTTPSDKKNQSLPFVVYPNPATEILHIRMIDNECPVTRVELLDYYGKVIRAVNQGDQGVITLDMNSLRSGNYILKVTSGEVYSTVITKK